MKTRIQELRKQRKLSQERAFPKPCVLPARPSLLWKRANTQPLSLLIKSPSFLA